MSDYENKHLIDLTDPREPCIDEARSLLHDNTCGGESSHISTDLIVQADAIREAVNSADHALGNALAHADTPEKAVELAMFMDGLAQKFREWCPRVRDHACDLVGKGDVTLGGQRYYVTIPKDYDQQLTNREMTDEALRVCDGDQDKAADLMSSGAWKHGAYRTLLEQRGELDRFDKAFKLKDKKKLETGKAKRQLTKEYRP